MSLLFLSLMVLAADKIEMIQALGGSKSDALELLTGGLVLREGEAGAAFGAARIGKGERRFTYFLVIKHNLAKAESADFGEEANAENTGGTTKQKLSLDGKKMEVVYTISVASGKKTAESLTVSGRKEPFKLSEGRVFLVDLTASPPTCVQRKVELAAGVEASTKKLASELAKRVLAKLAKQDKKVKEFIAKAR